MKLFQTAVAAGVFALPASLFAAPPSLSVHVPFAFVMAGQEFTAGDYRVQQSDNGVICVQGEGRAAMAISYPGSPAKAYAPAALEFSPDAQRRLVGVQMDGTIVRVVPVLEPERKVSISQAR